MDKRFGTLCKVLSGLMGITFFALMLLLFVNVVLRYFFSYAISWAEEITSEGLIFIVFLGLPILSLRGKHIKIDLLNQFLGPEANAALGICSKIVETFVALALLLAGSHMVYQIFPIKEKLIASGLPVWVLFSIIPVMFLITLTVLCIDWFSYAAEKKV